MVLQIFLGWVATLVVAGVSAGIMTAVLVYSPNKLMSDDRVYANKALNAESLAMVNLGGGPTGPLGVSLPPPPSPSCFPPPSPSCVLRTVYSACMLVIMLLSALLHALSYTIVSRSICHM